METRKKPRVAIVSPCYNEEAALPHTLKAFNEVMTQWKTQGLIAETS